MNSRFSVRLRFEELEEKSLPSANPIAAIEPPIEVQTSWDSNLTTPTSPNGSGGGFGSFSGIEPINPLPGGNGNWNLPPRPTMPPIDPVKEAALLQTLNATLTATTNEINNLDPTDPNYLANLGALQLKQLLLGSAIAQTQGIAANVLAFAALVPVADALEAQIRPLLQNPPTTVEGMNHLLGLIGQYGVVHNQMLALVNSTVELFASRNEVLGILGIPSGY